MRDQGKSGPLLMAGLAAVAVVAVVTAPAADARPFCDEAGGTTICQTNGSTSIKATPGTVSPPAGRYGIPWYGGSRRGYRR